ncbi:hypothetical protein [Streptomyces sp. NTH33]|uniref:hypothetical protein n=1 Tax=Streptomyces sp. NTH33 TaxID=1735453 RepID=UPI0015E8B305|nr:hypothetical protein [Streptomyces sp. NTH33]
MRWSLISLMAAAVLAVTRAYTTVPAAGIALVPASPRELLAVLRVTALPAPHRGLAHVLAWSAWRRHHQHQAAQAHRRWNNVIAEVTA